MRGVVFTGNSTLEMRDFPTPEPGPGEALLRVRASALCGTELPMYRSPKGSGGTIPGHEMAGEVVTVNETRHLAVGDRVSVHIMVGCGECFYCLRGDTKHCLHVDFLLGGYGEYVTAPEACCIPLPEDLDCEHGVLVIGDLVGTPYRAITRARVTALDTVAVCGCGPIGLGVLNILRFLGARTVASEVTPYRRALAERVGAARVVDPTRESLPEVVREITDGLGADIAFDCSARQETLNDALDSVRCQGTVAVMGDKEKCAIAPGRQVMYRETEVIGSLYFDRADVPGMLDLYRRGLAMAELVTHRFPLAQADEAFKTFASGESGKVLIVQRGD